MPDFLAFALFPDAAVLDADPGDSAQDVLTAILPNVSTFLFHLNCTLTSRFPEQRSVLIAALEARGIRVLNAGLTDISKRSIQDACRRAGLATTQATRDGDADELLMVKTDSTYGGEIERTIPVDVRDRLGLGAPSSAIEKASDYPVMRRADIPLEWWSDPSLIVERFVSNSANRWYRAYFLMSHFVISEMTNPMQVKKVGKSTMTRQWFFDDDGEVGVNRNSAPCNPRLVEAARRLRNDARIDFGAMDVVVDDDDNPFVIDINSTPAYFHPVPGLDQHLRGGLAQAGSR